MSREPRPVWQVGAVLGEGPVWLDDEQALRFVDIKRGHLHKFDPVSGRGTTQEVGGKPSFVVATEDGSLLVGSGHALHLGDGQRLGDVAATIDMPGHNRINDATVDGHGRLWFGTMDEDERVASGRLYCLDRGLLRASPWIAVVTNGPAVNRAGTVLYHVDSGERTIWAVALVDGQLGGGEVFLRLGESDGYPDGVVTDADDCLWVALWDGWGVRRYSPGGELLLHVPLPCPRVTKLAFGGPSLTTAYVTTARVGLDDEALAASPLAGSLFAFDAPVPGRLLPKVRLA